VGERIEEPKELMIFSLDEELNDNEDNVVLLEMIDGDEKVEEPKTSMTFTSLDEVISYYRKVAKQSGFGGLTRTKKKTIQPRYKVLTCSCEGRDRTNTSNVAKPTPTTIRTGCHARICASACVDGTWFLSKVVLKHNHQLSPRQSKIF
jgi:hypothetical protein